MNLVDPDVEARARRQWGRWSLEPYSLELLLEEDGIVLYAIDLERMNTSAAVLDWIVQVTRKVFTSPQDIGDLVTALDDIFYLQGRLCSGCCRTGDGVGQRIDATRYLKRRYGHPAEDAPSTEGQSW